MIIILTVVGMIFVATTSLCLVYSAKKQARITDIKRLRRELANETVYPDALFIFDKICKWSRFYRLPLDQEALQKEAVVSLVRHIEYCKKEHAKLEANRSKMTGSEDSIRSIVVDSQVNNINLYHQLSKLQLRLVDRSK
jgi:hypothetical protein